MAGYWWNWGTYCFWILIEFYIRERFWRRKRVFMRTTFWVCIHRQTLRAMRMVFSIALYYGEWWMLILPFYVTSSWRVYSIWNYQYIIGSRTKCRKQISWRWCCWEKFFGQSWQLNLSYVWVMTELRLLLYRTSQAALFRGGGDFHPEVDQTK